MSQMQAALQQTMLQLTQLQEALQYLQAALAQIELVGEGL
jgi:hypothetical protein